MKIYIRSQNKDFLEKCSGLYIAHTDDNIWSIINSTTMTIYGRYKTRKRALEVLNEIQKIISTFNTENGNYVYEMPEE